MKNKLVVIFGASGSGKTTLATEIYSFYGEDKSVIISQDNYYKGIDKSITKNFDEPEAIDFELLENNLIKLLQGKEIKSPIYDFVIHKRKNDFEIVKPKNFVILEGTMIMVSKIIRKISNYSIYCDIPLDISFIRRLQRDIHERGRHLDGVINQYLNEVRPAFYKYTEKYKSYAHFFYNEQNKKQLFNNIGSLK